ncbi:hypothetical protein Micbo1qcDRAFT_203626 [Microdochium bolleyi]|uniref:Uncharacterized protein n=1 Tax=Microdochium bolleyi TaxID=196109 RepID=A0A136J8Y7_9PEZI|nr:hypothetical protein Micbo1qcDRAFT_203626 [Microdochium bolleyi]
MQGNPPSLTGSTVWLSGDASDGFDVVLSGDTQAKVRGVLEGCGTLNNQCFHDVQQVLALSDLQIDSQLNKRTFLALLSKTFKSLASELSAITSVLIFLWSTRFNDRQFAQVFVPHPIGEAAAPFAVPGTEIIVEADGAPLVTVTVPAPAKTTLLGPSQPSVTAVTTPSNGLELGDLLACLDLSLASRIDEAMHRMSDCQDGRDFDALQGSSRAGTSYGSAICGAEAVVTMVRPGGAFNDMLLINPTSVAIKFSEVAVPVFRASRVLAEFVLAYAPMLDIPTEAAEMLGNFVFALAVQTLVENVPLAAENPILGKLLSNSPENPSDKCPDVETNPLTCGFDENQDCDILLPTKPHEYPTCKSGEYKGCPCVSSPYAYVYIASHEEITAMIHLAELFANSQPPPASAACDVENMTEVPASVFFSSRNNVYHHFCTSWSPSVGDLHMDVNAAGDNLLPEPHTRPRPGGWGGSSARAPPPDPSIWSQYKFSLNYKPNQGGGSCSADCTAAFEKIGTACRQNGGNDPKLAAKGSFDAGCGVFSYEVGKSDSSSTPPAALKIYDRQCFPRENPPVSHGIVQGDQMYGNAWIACISSDTAEPKMLKASDKPFESVQNVWDTDTGYYFSVSWEKGCTLENGQDSQAVQDPLGVGVADGIPCVGLQVDNYKQCDNGAAGGKVRAGCLVYEFKPTSRP